MIRVVVPAGGVPPQRPWPHAFIEGSWLEKSLEQVGPRPHLIVGERRFADQLGPEALLVPGGESGKTPEALAALLEALVRAGVTRQTVLIAVGGGATTDLVGLAAAMVLRGIDWVAVPTTILAAVDASLGGKTAVNLSAGKNLMGAFHQPLAVVVDRNFWTSLAAEEVVSASAEILKVGLLRPSLLTPLMRCSSAQEASAWVGEAAAVKLDVVAADPHEAGLRRCLNLGHTLGHALETQGEGRLRHGEAVAIGLAAVLRLGHAKADALVAKMQQWGLPVTQPDWAEPKGLCRLMLRDKKVTAQGLVVVVPQSDGACELWDNFEPSRLLA